MDTVEPFVTSREMLHGRWKFTFPLAKDYTIKETLRLDFTAPERMTQRVLYVVTPTYTRPLQMVDMVRLKQTLQLASLVKHRYIYWIVIEDNTASSGACTRRIRNLLVDSGLDFAHVAQVSIPDTPSSNPYYQHKASINAIGHWTLYSTKLELKAWFILPMMTMRTMFNYLPNYQQHAN
jgi:hypothetical protein